MTDSDLLRQNESCARPTPEQSTRLGKPSARCSMHHFRSQPTIRALAREAVPAAAFAALPFIAAVAPAVSLVVTFAATIAAWGSTVDLTITGMAGRDAYVCPAGKLLTPIRHGRLHPSIRSRTGCSAATASRSPQAQSGWGPQSRGP
jgi:hypothetical protein